ncbi:MAG: hypothetical protein AAF236_11555 [Verrucomicrobiota bacterium]
MIFSRSLLTRSVLAVSAVMLLCQCQTQRTVKSVRSSISFDEGMWGGQGGGDQDQIREKFINKGFKIDEQGNFVANETDLYSDSEARGLDGSFRKKQARFGRDEFQREEFRTPEYIARQEFNGTSEARESGAEARESNFAASRNDDSGRLFGRRGESRSTSGETFETGAYRAGERQVAYQENREAAQADSVRPQGYRQTAGFKSNASLSVDDVRKMVSPGSIQ